MNWLRRQDHIQAALRELLQAVEYAQDVQHDVWDFAVEIDRFRELGLNDSDLRWLVCKGYVDHSREVTWGSDDRRTFCRSGTFTFTRRTCFVLTEEGLAFARAVCCQTRREQAAANGQRGRSPQHQEPAVPAEPLVPEWDPELRELRVGGQLVKRFRLPAANQEMILQAFQQAGWPKRIPDPLPVVGEEEPKRRLNDTLKALNRNHKTQRLRFLGDGTGVGILWELVSPRDCAKD